MKATPRIRITCPGCGRSVEMEPFEWADAKTRRWGMRRHWFTTRLRISYGNYQSRSTRCTERFTLETTP